MREHHDYDHNNKRNLAFEYVASTITVETILRILMAISCVVCISAAFLQGIPWLLYSVTWSRIGNDDNLGRPVQGFLFLALKVYGKYRFSNINVTTSTTFEELDAKIKFEYGRLSGWRRQIFGLFTYLCCDYVQVSIKPLENRVLWLIANCAD
jgi:hypothetical protein